MYYALKLVQGLHWISSRWWNHISKSNAYKLSIEGGNQILRLKQSNEHLSMAIWPPLLWTSFPNKFLSIIHWWLLEVTLTLYLVMLGTVLSSLSVNGNSSNYSKSNQCEYNLKYPLRSPPVDSLSQNILDLQVGYIQLTIRLLEHFDFVKLFLYWIVVSTSRPARLQLSLYQTIFLKPYGLVVCTQYHLSFLMLKVSIRVSWWISENKLP